MNKPYVIYVNNLIWARKLTKQGAEGVIARLRLEGLTAVLAYQPENLRGNI